MDFSGIFCRCERIYDMICFLVFFQKNSLVDIRGKVILAITVYLISQILQGRIPPDFSKGVFLTNLNIFQDDHLKLPRIYSVTRLMSAN